MSRLPVILLLLFLLLYPVSTATQAQPADLSRRAGEQGSRGAFAPAQFRTEPHQLLAPIYEDLCPGEIFPFQFTIYLPRTPARGDIILALDTTNSMQGVIRSAQENAIRIMDELSSMISDVHFGVMDIEDYPLDPYGQGDNEAYRLRQPLTGDREAVRAAIDSLWANSGGDLPEAYTRAIYEAYADPRIGWRDNARRLLLMFGDSVSHDDALNEGVPSPPYRPPWDWDWETGFPPSFLDPGRDGIPGTYDDLDFQTELAALAEHNITLLSVVTSSTFPQPDHSELVTYWNHWAARTGGKAEPLWNAGELPDLIRRIVEETIVGVIKRLALHTAPEYYSSWVYSDPVEITDIPVPSDGAYSFLGRVEAPPDIRPGTYRFRIMAVGDGIIYGEKPVEITVPTGCSPEPDYPNWYYLPLVSKEHVAPPPVWPPIEPTPYPGPDSTSTR